jgi:hypothetical protein
VDDRRRAGWAASAGLAIGGVWLLFVGGPGLQTLLVAVVAFAATFLLLDVPALLDRRRGRGPR